MLLERGSPTNPRILVIDDERAVIESLTDLLRKEFNVIGTDDVGIALSLLESQEIALILADQRMPRMTGAELLACALRIQPDTVRILVTAYSDIQAVIQAVNDGRMYYYLAKPWDAKVLLELVRGGTQQYLKLAERRNLLKQLAELNRMGDVSPTPPAIAQQSPAVQESDASILQASLQQLQSTFNQLAELNEVIPICMSCGMIKTSNASWENVVEYLKNNTSYLSHGYCPSCAAKHMAEWNMVKE